MNIVRHFTRLSSLLILLALSACSFTPAAQRAVEQPNWLKDGIIVISRTIPNPSTFDTIPNTFAFLPVQGAKVGLWISIDRNASSIALMDGDTALDTSSAQGVDGLAPGNYEILHKQRAALWYAPDSYFQSRNLPVPAQNDRNRYRRGALGEYVFFIGENTPIHSGPIWLKEIGGARLDQDQLAKMYYRLSVGTPVEVK